MQFYPALSAKMGIWDYYIVKMKMKDIVKEVHFASEIYEDKTLDDAIQRTLNESRVKKEIVSYLGKRSDRFFSSIVVAALGGHPRFTPVEIADDPRFEIVRPGFDQAFGVLSFDGGQKYFALDGQHRLKSIKTLIEQKENDLPEMPDGFKEEEISVIMLVRKEEDYDEFLRGYRRIFSSLNRYAKPTDPDTNIIMDEDDTIAILTRRLLIDHDFFKWEGKASTSPKLKTKTKNIRSGEPFFTTLQTLYGMNEILLNTLARERAGFMSKEYKQFRQPEEELDKLFEELKVYWDALLLVLDVLKSDPVKMRSHNSDPSETDLQDHLLFWPIGQEILTRTIRALLNQKIPSQGSPILSDVQKCIQPLSVIDWNLHQPPWRGLLLISDPDGSRKRIRNEERKPAQDLAFRILRAKVHLDDPNEDHLNELKTEWHAMLIPNRDRSEVDADWRAFFPEMNRHTRGKSSA